MSLFCLVILLIWSFILFLGNICFVRIVLYLSLIIPYWHVSKLNTFYAFNLNSTLYVVTLVTQQLHSTLYSYTLHSPVTLVTQQLHLTLYSYTLHSTFYSYTLHSTVTLYTLQLHSTLYVTDKLYTLVTLHSKVTIYTLQLHSTL